MGQLVGEREHLGRLGVGTVDEDDRRQRIGQREAPELFRIELAVGVVADDPADHDQHAEIVRLLDEPAKRSGPGPHPAALRQIEPEGVAHPCGGLDNVAAHLHRADEIERALADRPRVVPIPLLPLLAGVDRLQQIWAGVPDVDVADGPEVGDRNALLGRLLEEEVADGRVRRLGELLQLPEGRHRLPALPELDPREPASEAVDAPAGPLAGPAKHARLDVDALHRVDSGTGADVSAVDGFHDIR